MTPRIALCSAALALAACLSAAPSLAVVFDSTLVAGPFTTRTKPRIAVSNAGAPELLYACLSAGQMTAWRYSPGASPEYETVASDLATSTYPQPLWALAPSGAPRAAYFKPNGRFVVALRDSGGWVEDSSLAEVVFSTGCQQWLAADPVSGEPRVAFTVADGASWRVKYAWREGGTWSVADVDTDFASYTPVHLALDAAGRPYVAYTSVTGETLFVASRGSPGESFGREAVTVAAYPAVYFHASVAVDPAGGQPRVTYYYWGDDHDVGYASRDELGTWTNQWVDTGLPYAPLPVTLALDEFGNPTIACTEDVNILATSPARTALAPDAPLEGGTTGLAWFARRIGGAGTAPFTLTQVPLHDVIVEAGGMAVTTAGLPCFALRSPELSSGPPLHYSVVYAHYEPDPVDVPPAAPGEFALAPPAPNPARAGGLMRIGFTSPRSDVVRCDLLDPSGRRVATLPSQRCAAGPNTLSWTPGPLSPGLYFVRLRLGAGPVVVRRLALLR